MKTTRLTIILVLALCAKSHAQTAGTYITNNTMSAFHGTWQWVSGTDTLKIYLATKKAYYPINGGFYWDQLCGWHIYKKGNTVVSSSFGSINNTNARTLSLANNSSHPMLSEGWIKDVSKNKSGELKLSLNAAQNQLTWKLENAEGVRFRNTNEPAYDWTFSFPEYLVLTRQ